MNMIKITSTGWPAWLVLASAALSAPTIAAVDTPAPGKVVVSGTVPDEATRQAVLTRAREVFGADRVVDQLGVGNLVAPPNWTGYVQRIISPDLKQVSRGQISVVGNVIDIKGEVGNEATRQQIASDLSTRLNATYTVNNARSNSKPAIRVSPPPGAACWTCWHRCCSVCRGARSKSPATPTRSARGRKTSRSRRHAPMR
jgi:hypothetical protein